MLKIIALAILLIGFIMAVLMMGMFLSAKGITTERIGFLIIALGFGIILIKRMKRLKKNLNKSGIDNVA